MQCGVLSLSYKEKKSYLVPKCATYRPSGTAPVTSLYDITRVPSACFSRARSWWFG